MKKKWLSLALALILCLGLLPVDARAAELPDWYFLFAIFKNMDAEGKDENGRVVRAKCAMPQEEVDFIGEVARDFEEYMNSLGIMRVHIELVEIDTTVTELGESIYGAWLDSELAAPLLEGKVDLDRYDHVFCIVNLDDLDTYYLGLTGAAFANGTGHSCMNLRNAEYCQNTLRRTTEKFMASSYVHEFLHFMNQLNEKWGSSYDLHKVQETYNTGKADGWRGCYTDMLLNRATGGQGTGVIPAAWQYPPHVLRTMTELNVPAGVTGIGDWAFTGSAALTKVTIPGSVSGIGKTAFQDCAGLTEATISAGVTGIGNWAFGNCTALSRVSIPASVTSINYAAFWNTGIKDVYYGGTEAQWRAIQIGEYNDPLTGAAIHYNSLMADVKTTDWFAQPVAWALERGITSGTGGGNFSPNATCTQAQILTLLWHAKGSPEPAGAVSGSQYYAAAVQWAAEHGLVEKTLSPNAPCTRAMVVDYLWKLSGSPAPSGQSGFTDVPARSDSADAVAWAVEQGITSGTGKATFSPEGVCTRGQIVTFLYRALAE